MNRFRIAVTGLTCMPLSAALSLGVAQPLAACRDQAKESAARAAHDDAFLADLVEKDVAEIERGMPQGAVGLAPLVANGSDPRLDVAAVRKGLLRMRRDVVDLNIAKSTFFALADANGIAIRNDLEEDVMAGQDLLAIFPAIARAKSEFVTTTGAFPNSATSAGPDRDWVAAIPVKRADGSTGAILVTGWSYRYFSRHLQATLQSHLIDEAKSSGREGNLPIYYVAVFDRTGVYSAPLTPQVDEKALADQDLVARTTNGPTTGTLRITETDFGFAAQRTPKLAPDTGVVVLRSEL
jgi:hypothetical protein